MTTAPERMIGPVTILDPEKDIDPERTIDLVGKICFLAMSLRLLVVLRQGTLGLRVPMDTFEIPHLIQGQTTTPTVINATVSLVVPTNFQGLLVQLDAEEVLHPTTNDEGVVHLHHVAEERVLHPVDMMQYRVGEVRPERLRNDRPQDVKTKPEPILPPPPLPPIPKSSSSSTTTSSMRTPSSTVSQGTTAPGHRYDSYLARSQSLHRSSSRARSRSRERGRSKSRAASRERDRGRSKSRARSKERDRGRSKSRAGSRERDRDRDRGRSKSRARSTARHRSMSRPRVSVVTMGEFTRKRARSPSRSRRKGDSDEDQSDSDLDSLSSASDDYLYRTRSGRSYGHRKKRRYLSSDSSDNSSDISDNDSDDTTMTRKSRPDLTRAGLPSDPMMRFNGPLTDMITKMGVVMEACTSQSEKLMAKVRKLETIKKKIDREMKELGKELRVQKMQGSGSGSPQIGQSEVVAAGGPGYFQDLSRPFGPVPVPPSLKPVASGSGGGSSSSGMVTLRIPPNVDHGASHAFPHPRASGFRRVFEKSTYTLPVSTQANLTVLSLGTKKVFESFFGGRRPGYVQINPFSHQTQFEGIAASSSMDGNIHFWDINAQKMLLSVPPRDSRVIPYAETITWVSEDAIVAVSHLKNGIKWPEPNAEPSNTELTAHSEPEAQTNLITIYFNREGQLGFRVLTITTMPHLKPITTVAAIMGEDHSVSYVTGGSDKRLFHWKFGPPDSQSPTGYEPQGLVELHQAHSNSISSTIYSHTSKLLYSGGLDGKYVSFNLEEQKVVTEQRVLGKISHIVQNPMDPRINLVGTLGYSRQYLLMDERTPTQPALTFGYRTQNATSKLSVPSWQPGGGLVCTGTNVEGTLYLWDVRWSSVRLDYRRRPGVGVVTGDGAGYAAGGKHPIFRAPLTGYDVPKTETAGAPTQIFKVAGKKVQQACFHPTKNVLLMVNSDNNLTFMDYDLRVDTVTL
ncbi:MAG: WD40-repeat-containing domain protein [Benniella sp.]|nr:MAG: WD40-repeat-containing domain protein [Benniella sp.]